MLADDTVRLLRFIKAGSEPNDRLGKFGAEMAEGFSSLPMPLKIAIPALALPAAVVGGIVLAPIAVGIGALVAIGGASAVLAGTAGAVSAQPESNGTKDLTVLPMVEASNFRVINERPVREGITYATHHSTISFSFQRGSCTLSSQRRSFMRYRRMPRQK